MFKVGTVVRLGDEAYERNADQYKRFGVGRGAIGVVTGIDELLRHNEVEVAFFSDVEPGVQWTFRVENLEEVTDAHDQGD